MGLEAYRILSRAKDFDQLKQVSILSIESRAAGITYGSLLQGTRH